MNFTEEYLAYRSIDQLATTLENMGLLRPGATYEEFEAALQKCAEEQEDVHGK